MFLSENLHIYATLCLAFPILKFALWYLASVLKKMKYCIKKGGITFSQVIEANEHNGMLLDFVHPNKIKYPKQMIMVIKLNDYTYCIPYVIEEDVIFLKTAYPNRKFLYLIEQEE